MPQRTLQEIVSGREHVVLPLEATVRAAVDAMAATSAPATLVVHADGGLVGIFTKRDLLARVVADDRDIETTPLADVMTPSPHALDAARKGFEALRLMRENGCRHCVVTGLDGDGFGLVSTRDFFPTEISDADNELAFEKKVWEEL